MRKTKLVGQILRIVIGLVILVLIVGHVNILFNTIRDLKYQQGVELNFIKIVKAVFYLTYLISPIIFLVAAVGYFWKSMTGWIMLTILFYFTLFDNFFINIPSYSNSLLDYLFLLIPLCFVFIMNMKTIRRIYNTKNNIVSNLIAILTSLLIVFISGYVKLNYDMHIFEIIEKIK
jgi:hypothetical protein